MVESGRTQQPTEPKVTVREVNRVLEVGRMLLSVLTPEELAELEESLNTKPALPRVEIGIAGDS